MNGHHSSSPAKRRRTSTPDSDDEASFTRPNAKSMRNDHIAISSSSRFASQAVSPFLSRHIPDQYAPQGAQVEVERNKSKDPNTKYCYRHQPDLKCRRQADEPSMDQLQHELESLSQSDQKAIAHVWAVFSASPAKHRDLMLRGILTQCCFPQLSLLSNSVRELIRIDFLSALPNEIGYKILCFLDTASLCKAAQVSQNWRALAEDDVVWHRMCEQHIDRKCNKCGWGLPLLEKQRLRETKRLIQMRAAGRGINEWSPRITPVPEAGPSSQDLQGLAKHGLGPEQISAADGRHFEDSYFPKKQRPWKDVYKDRFRVGANWKHGRYSSKVFKGHTNGVTCLQFDDQILTTGSYDSTIKIWNIETGEEIQTLRGHTCGLRCLQFDGTKLISGSLDKTLRIWNLQTGACIRTLPGHTDGVIGLHFVDSYIASGSKDNTIRLWNFKDSSSTVLRGHRDWVNAVKIDMPSRTLFSASDDLTVRLWDMDTKATIKIYKGHVGHIQQVLPLPREFEFGESEPEPRDPSSSDSDSRASTPAEGQPTTVVVAGTTSTSTSSTKDTLGPAFSHADRPLPPRYMLTSGLDNHIHLWDVATGACLRTFFGHVEGVWALAADTLRAVSGAQDCMVKVWDARSGRCEATFAGHRGPIACIGLSDSRICTGSEDCEVRMMSFKSEGEVAG